MNLIQFCTEDI